MAEDEQNEGFDAATEGDDDLVIEAAGVEQAEMQEALKAQAEAAAQIEFVVLPLACLNEGKGAPLGMGIQRWWAQEMAKAGAKAAAPVFTAMADQNGQKVPALMIYRDPWTDARIVEGIGKFANAKKGLATNLRVSETEVAFNALLVEVEGEGEDATVKELHRFDKMAKAEELPKVIFEVAAELRALLGHELDEEPTEWAASAGTKDHQAFLSFLVGLGNLSALQGRCVPSTSDQLLNPLMDALNRDDEYAAPVEALHAMTDILIGGQPDRASVPLSVQALQIAAQKRPNDKSLWHHLALVLRRLGDAQASVSAFNQAFNLAPNDAQLASNFIETLRRLDDTENAMKVAQFAVERGNEGPAVFAQLGALLIDRDQFDHAEPFLRRAIDEGKVPGAFGNLANVLWDRGEEGTAQQSEDREEALTLLETALDLPNVAKPTLDMMLDLAEDEDDKVASKARSLLLQATEKHPNTATVRIAAANMLMDADKPEEAKPHLAAVLELPRRSLDDDAFARRQMLSLTMDDFDERYDAAVEKIQSGSAEGMSDAARFMREVIATDEMYWQPHLMLALAVREPEGDAAALGHLANAVQLRPNDAEIRNLMAAILRKQGNPREAVEHLRVVVALNPREVDPVAMLASTMRDANMFEEARQVCTTALQMIPDHPQFKAILASLPPAKDA